MHVSLFLVTLYFVPCTFYLQHAGAGTRLQCMKQIAMVTKRREDTCAGQLHDVQTTASICRLGPVPSSRYEYIGTKLLRHSPGVSMLR